MARSWLKTIARLKKFIEDVGALWTGTKLSGYSDHGPFHCADCRYLLKREGEVFRDPDAKGRCTHAIVMADPELTKDQKGLAIINIEHGCCEYVDQPKEEHEESEESEENEDEAS